MNKSSLALAIPILLGLAKKKHQQGSKSIQSFLKLYDKIYQRNHAILENPKSFGKNIYEYELYFYFDFSKYGTTSNSLDLYKKPFTFTDTPTSMKKLMKILEWVGDYKEQFGDQILLAQMGIVLGFELSSFGAGWEDMILDPRILSRFMFKEEEPDTEEEKEFVLVSFDNYIEYHHGDMYDWVGNSGIDGSVMEEMEELDLYQTEERYNFLKDADLIEVFFDQLREAESEGRDWIYFLDQRENKPKNLPCMLKFKSFSPYISRDDELYKMIVKFITNSFPIEMFGHFRQGELAGPKEFYSSSISAPKIREK
jgi:hypothetical protein